MLKTASSFGAISRAMRLAHRPETHPLLDRLAGYAMAYYRDFVEPTKSYRAPDDQERADLAMVDLARRLRDTADFAKNSYGNENIVDPLSQESLQSLTFSVGKEHGLFENLPRLVPFPALYEVLLGQSQGPRFGGFIALYGVEETAAS